MPDFIASLEPITSLLGQPRDLALIFFLMAAAVIDWRTYRIPNWLTVGGMVFGLIYNTVAASSLQGFLWALGGLGAGLVVLLPLYVLRVMGAGDVKLMAMVGAFLGLPDILFAVVYTLIAGGVAALAFAAYHRALRRLTGNVLHTVQSLAFSAMAGLRPMPATATASIGKLPYGISIALGTIAWLAASRMGIA